MPQVFAPFAQRAASFRPHLVAAALVSSLAWSLCACAGSDQLLSKPGADTADAALADSGAAAEIAATPDVSPVDVKEVTADIAVVCPGGSGCACKVDSECVGSLCSPTDAGKKCAALCSEKGTCAVGAGCKIVTTAAGLGLKICVVRQARFCEPCTDSLACKTLTEPNSHCVAVGGDKGATGFYCTAACETQLDCGPGSSCKPMLAAEGTNVGGHCVPDTGACNCSTLAVHDAAKTVCSLTTKKADGTVIGSCKGGRSCSASGLSTCSAKTPVAETCNGSDDNCDGSVDEGKLCDDGNVCTTDSCGGQSGCEFIPTIKQCNDGKDCTKDGCDAKAGCTHVNTTDPCDDGTKCTTADTCKDGACSGAKLECDDNNPCTDQICKPASGCLVVNNEDGCSDGNACTLSDKCKDSKCVAGASKACDDGNGCSNDGCDPAKGCTQTSAQGQPCDDGNACTLPDACTASACQGIAIGCDDANGCTLDSCDKLKGCLHLPAAPTNCDDGNVCTINDQCGGGVCMAGAATKCDDGEYCTKDSCDAKAKGCVNLPLPVTTPCSDGSVCSQNDVCQSGQCVGVLQTCDDKNPCTEDFCDKTKGCDSKVLTGSACAIECYTESQCNSGVCKGATKAADGAMCSGGSKTCASGVCGP